jgi:hypothetical protein
MNIHSHFGAYRSVGHNPHNGIDILPATHGVAGDPIFAVNSGKVVVSKFNSSYGNYVVIDHGDWCSLYAHLNSVVVMHGTVVGVGQIIGFMGTTGNSTGVHLHFEVHQGGWTGSIKNRVDPEKYLGNAANSAETLSASNLAALGDPVQTGPIEYMRVQADLKKQVVYDQIFGRKYRIIVSNSDGEAFDVSKLHVIFSVKRSMIEVASSGTVKIYNLEINTENKIIQEAKYVDIEAGYEGANYGVIYSGEVIQVLRGKENATDSYVELILLSQAYEYMQEIVEFTYKRGQSQRQMIDYLVARNLPIDSTEQNIADSRKGTKLELGTISEAYDKVQLTRGKAVFGKADAYLAQIAKGQSAQFYTSDGRVNIVKANELPTDEVIKLDYTSGLVGTPTQTDQGINFKCLLNPMIREQTLVHIDNSSIVERRLERGQLQWPLDTDGIYRAVNVTYDGDNRGPDWYCSVSAYTQVGSLPAMLADSAANPME